MPSYWLFKTEPDEFGIANLQQQKQVVWDGVRNYAARNSLRDDVRVGDWVFIYHSSCKELGIAGIARVVKSGYPDPAQFQPSSPFLMPKPRPISLAGFVLI